MEWNRMRDEVKHWLRGDLEAHGGRVKVVLNHEPFFGDPSWPLDAEELAEYVVSDEGIFEGGSVNDSDANVFADFFCNHRHGNAGKGGFATAGRAMHEDVHVGEPVAVGGVFVEAKA